MNFKPAGLSDLTQVITWVLAAVFVVTLIMSFGSELLPRLTCLIVGIMLLSCWRVSTTDLEPVRNFSLGFCDFGRISLVAVFK